MHAVAVHRPALPGAYGHVENVLALRSQLNDGIERQMKGKRPLAQMGNRQRTDGPRGREVAVDWNSSRSRQHITEHCRKRVTNLAAVGDDPPSAMKDRIKWLDSRRSAARLDLLRHGLAGSEKRTRRPCTREGRYVRYGAPQASADGRKVL